MDLAHFISKAAWFVVRPGNLLLLVLLAGTLFAWRRPGGGGRLWLTLLSALLLFVTVAPVYSWIARPLEDRFPSPASVLAIDPVDLEKHALGRWVGAVGVGRGYSKLRNPPGVGCFTAKG